MSAGLTSARDVSMRNNFPGAGLAVEVNYMCTHKGTTAGGMFRVMPRGIPRLPWLCPACNAAKKAAQAAKAVE